MNDLSAGAPAVHGTVARGWERVREAFAQNFARNDAFRECGAALAVYHRGEAVVDLWGGHADRARTRPWQRDTLINVYSTSKGIVATAVAMLVDEGRLDYDARVTRWWPEFGAAGKESTTVAQLLSHQAALTGFTDPLPLPVEKLYDWDSCVRALAAQAPCWPPGTRTSYHAMTWGYLAGELVRRASGMSVGRYVRERIARRLGADVHIGLGKGDEPRVAEMLAPKTAPDLAALTQPRESLLALVSPQLDPEICNRREWRAAEIPAASGQASAQGVARVYAALASGGEFAGARLLSRDTLARATARVRGQTDLLLGFTDAWSMGWAWNQHGMLGPRAGTFGHSGWGGSFGCADADAGIAIGYVCNQMGAQLVGDPRSVSLCAAIFDCAGN
ncbi:MAG TPA: serine hydrolase domain-containing protein [Nevskiaceae bacterium]|nr:serine hydrolase domain-containing protein [Nevskiaceae bacterium]